MRHAGKMGLLASLALGLLVACAPAAPPPPGAAGSATQEQGGFKTIASRDELAEKARQEGRLRVLASLDPEGIKKLVAAFKQRYPSIDLYVEEFTGTDSYQRFLLELQSGTVGDWDVGYVPPEYYSQFEAYIDKYDLLAMAQQGVLQIPPQMVDPTYRNLVTFGSQAAGISYNPRRVPPEQAPRTWEDLLRPEWKGKKMVVDVRPSNIAPLVAEWGLDKTLDYARKLAAQEPIWDRGQTAALTKVAAGELLMHTFSNYHSALRVQARASEQDIKVELVEPVPVRISETFGVLKTARRPYAALLFLEYMASPEAQQILDEVELKASIYGSGGRLKRLIEGKKTAVADYAHFEKMEDYMARIVEAFGFPRAELGR